MKRTAFLFAIVLLLLPFIMAFPKVPRPGCRIRFDNMPNGGALDLTATADHATVIVGFTDGTTDSGPIDLSTVSESHAILLGPACETIDWVYLATDGYDWLWIDQVELHKSTNNGWQLYSAKGIDNLQGWCISIDWSDGNDTVCEPNGSLPDRTWYF